LTHLFHGGQQSVVLPTYTVVQLSRTGGLSTRYPTADSVMDNGTSACQRGIRVLMHAKYALIH